MTWIALAVVFHGFTGIVHALIDAEAAKQRRAARHRVHGLIVRPGNLRPNPGSGEEWKRGTEGGE